MTQTVFFRQGVEFNPVAANSVEMHNELPPGNYVIEEDPRTKQLSFKLIDRFPAYKTVYGDMRTKVDRMFNTFMDRPAQTGILLQGEKGSGKTMIAKLLSIEGYKRNIPTIVIGKAWVGDAFNMLIQNLQQPAIVLFDEFEKVYKKEEQEQLLSLFEGTFPSKKMFIVTCNDRKRIDEHMRNRPGRFYYAINFVGLESDFIQDYCQKELKEALRFHTAKIVKIAGFFDQFNFDMLKCLVEEMNRYDFTPEDALELLNATPTGDDSEYDTEIIHKGKRVRTYPTHLKGTPIGRDKMVFTYYGKDEDDDTTTIEITFSHTDLIYSDAQAGVFHYKNEGGDTGFFARSRRPAFDIRNPNLYTTLPTK